MVRPAAPAPTQYPFSASALLDGIPGAAYLADRAGILMGFSRGPFLPTRRGRRYQPWDPATAIGHSLFSFVRGEQVRESYRALHDAVWSGRRDSLGFTYRCDAPDMERRMFMSLSRIVEGTETKAVLYQSLVISEMPRPPMPLFAFEGDYLAELLDPSRPLATLCSYCQRLAWPLGPAGPSRQWIDATEFYRRGGPADVVVSHGICSTCFDRVSNLVG